MTLHDLMHALDARGVKLSLRLVIDTPSGAVTDELRTALAAHKPHLLARLGRAAQWEVLAAQRWGPALTEPEADDGLDPYALAEREAIRTEAALDSTEEHRGRKANHAQTKAPQ